MKIKFVLSLILTSCFLSLHAQDRLQVGVNVFNAIANIPNRLEMSFQLKNNRETSQINPVLILGINSGKHFVTNTENSQNNQSGSQIIHQYSTRSQYIKAGIDIITKRKENGCDNYMEILFGYSNNTAINKVTVKGNYYDDYHYTDETTYKATIFQMWYIGEFKIYQDFLGSLGLGITTLGIMSNSNPNAPISEVGGGAMFFSSRNDIQYYIGPSLKFSLHYKF